MVSHCSSVSESIRPSVVHLSVSQSVFSFLDDNLSECHWIFTKNVSYLPATYLIFLFLININGVSQNLMCALIL